MQKKTSMYQAILLIPKLILDVWRCSCGFDWSVKEESFRQTE
jgi:hypothetical protein